MNLSGPVFGGVRPGVKKMQETAKSLKDIFAKDAMGATVKTGIALIFARMNKADYYERTFRTKKIG